MNLWEPTGVILTALGAAATFWTVRIEMAKRSSECDYKIIGLAEVVDDWHWSCRRLLRKLIALDLRLMNGRYGNREEGTVAQWSRIFDLQPDGWRLLTRRRKIVGYWSFVVLKDSFFEAIRSGHLIDGEIKPEWLEDLSPGKNYKMYFSMIAVEREHRRAGFMLLMKSLMDQLLILAKNGIYFSEVCAIAYTDDGKCLCKKSMAMTSLGQHDVSGEIFYRSFEFDGFALASQKFLNVTELQQLYSDHFEAGAKVAQRRIQPSQSLKPRATRAASKSD